MTSENLIGVVGTSGDRTYTQFARRVYDGVPYIVALKPLIDPATQVTGRVAFACRVRTIREEVRDGVTETFAKRVETWNPQEEIERLVEAFPLPYLKVDPSRCSLVVGRMTEYQILRAPVDDMLAVGLDFAEALMEQLHEKLDDLPGIEFECQYAVVGWMMDMWRSVIVKARNEAAALQGKSPIPETGGVVIPFPTKTTDE